MADYLNIAGRIRTTASDGVSVEASEVFDESLEKSQSEINSDTIHIEKQVLSEEQQAQVLSNIRDTNANNDGKMGYKVLQPESKATFQSQVTEPNTIYEIRDVFDVSGSTINLPENSVLKFNGGSIKNATIVFSNTLIDGESENIFKSGVVTQGSVANSEIRSSWFEYNGVDFYKQFKNIVALSTNSLKPIVFKKGDYVFKNDTTVDDDSAQRITITQSIDFGGSKITLDTNNHKNFAINVSNATLSNVDSSDYSSFKDIVNNRDYALSETSAKYRNCLVKLETGKKELQRKSTDGSIDITFNQKEIFFIDAEGYIDNEFFCDAGEFDNITSAKFIECNKKMYFRNAEFTIEDDYVSTERVTRWIGFVFENCANISVSNIILNHMDFLDTTRNDNALYIFPFKYIYNLSVENCLLPNTKLNPEDSQYIISLNEIVNLYMSNIKTGNLTSSAWGVTGSNYITNWTIDRCEFNRIDTHYRLNNLTVTNSKIGEAGIEYSGFGKIIVENCSFVNSQHALIPRNDFGAFFDGDIVIRDSDINVLSQSYSIAVLYIYETSLNYECTNSHFKIKGCKNLILENLRIFKDSRTNANIYQYSLIDHIASELTGLNLSDSDKYTSPSVRSINVDFGDFTPSVFDMYSYWDYYKNNPHYEFHDCDFKDKSVELRSYYSPYADFGEYYSDNNRGISYFEFHNCNNIGFDTRVNKASINFYNCNITVVPVIASNFALEKSDIAIYNSLIKPKTYYSNSFFATKGKLFLSDCIIDADTSFSTSQKNALGQLRTVRGKTWFERIDSIFASKILDFSLSQCYFGDFLAEYFDYNGELHSLKDTYSDDFTMALNGSSFVKSKLPTNRVVIGTTTNSLTDDIFALPTMDVKIKYKLGILRYNGGINFDEIYLATNASGSGKKIIFTNISTGTYGNPIFLDLPLVESTYTYIGFKKHALYLATDVCIEKADSLIELPKTIIDTKTNLIKNYLGTDGKGVIGFLTDMKKSVTWNGTDWVNVDGSPLTTHTITNTLSSVTNSNAATSIDNNKTYMATLSPAQDMAIQSVQVTMGGTDITSFVYNDTTHVIYIAAVTGNLVITATAGSPI